MPGFDPVQRTHGAQISVIGTRIAHHTGATMFNAHPEAVMSHVIPLLALSLTLTITYPITVHADAEPALHVQLSELATDLRKRRLSPPKLGALE